MNKISRRLIATVVAIVLLSPLIVLAGSHPLNEDAALNLLLRTLKHDNVYERRISLDCVTFDTEETTNAYFEFVLRENHTAKCGGDPDVSPVVDRYRVYRTSGKIEWYKAVNDSWQRYESGSGHCSLSIVTGIGGGVGAAVGSAALAIRRA